MVFGQIFKSCRPKSKKKSKKLIKILIRDLNLKTKFAVKTRDIHKIDKKNSIGISVCGYENKTFDLCIKTMLRRKRY